jgi:predicted O-methyltransferase YrrM
LIEFVALVTKQPRTVIAGYIAELHADEALQAHVRRLATLQSDPVARYARRAGWYALARATKPRVVVETGIDKGLGSCVLASALLRNRAEGHSGTYYGTEIDPAAGYLFRAPYTSTGEILLGDSIESLERLPGPIDLFINDSDHSADYERREYRTIADKLAPNAIVIGDNAHVTDELLRFARETDRTFLFWAERPKDHWYPGAGIGVVFRHSAP